MCEQDVEGLPLLPGLTFQDPTKSKFHRCQTFGFYQGGRYYKHYSPASGQYPRDIDSVRYLNIENDSIAYDPALTYGRAREYPCPAFRPHFVTYDKKCLTFNAFFKQPVYNSPDENYRVRFVNIIYYLDDDTLTVIEPPVKNSGLVQGKLVRKGKIPKYGHENGVYISWKDLNVGIDLPINGIVFHIVDCDLFTKEYLLCHGVEINDSECMPPDPYIQLRESKNQLKTTSFSSTTDKLRRFLEYEGRVLRFRAVWDRRDDECGTLEPYAIKYYLEDDTVEVAEIHERNDGKDPFPFLLKRIKLPKNWKLVPAGYPSVYLEKTDIEITEYYTPLDFIIGETVFVFGRRMLLHRCDEETRRYYCRALNIKQPENFEVEEPQKPKRPEPPPPHTGIGALDDSLASCQIVPKPPRKDVVRQIFNMNKFLRYEAQLDSPHPEDEGRKFIIMYSLSDSSIKILEKPIPNSGHAGGKFLAPTLVPKPGSHPDYPEYYSPVDFVLGETVTFFEHRFRLTGCDLQAYRYMEANPDKFDEVTMNSVRNYLVPQGLLKEDIATIARSELNPGEFPPPKICDPYPSLPPVDRAEEQPPPEPCELDPELLDKIRAQECETCPEPTGKVEPECKTGGPEEARVEELTGKLVFNRENPNWK